MGKDLVVTDLLVDSLLLLFLQEVWYALERFSVAC